MSGKSELRLFDEEMPQVVVQSAFFIDVSPHNAISDKTQDIEFIIQKSETEYLDLNDSLLYITYNVKHDGGAKALPDTAVVTPVNYLMNALFKDVELYLNNVMVEGGQGVYAYKSTIETIFGFNQSAKQFQIASMGYDETSDNRKAWIAKSKTAELVGALRLDFFNQPKYLLPGVEVKVKLIRHLDSFCLHGGGTESAKLTILNAKLYVRRVRVAPEVLLAHEDGLMRRNAIYPHTRGKVLSYSIPTGTLVNYNDNIFSSSLLPKFVIVGFVTSVGYAGDNLTSAPFNFQHFNLSSLGLFIDGQSVPYREVYKPRFSKGLVVKEYLKSIVHNFQHLNTNLNNGISLADFSTGNYSLFTFNLTPDFDMHQRQMPRDGNLRLEVTFEKELAASINVIVYGMFDTQIEITKDRDVLKA
jgi:hypothetical protein